MLVASETTSKKSTPIEAGAYVARCVQILDLGDQYNEMSGKWARKTMLTFELPTERIDVNGESKPKLMSKTYTLSLNEKATLRKDIESWFGRQLAGSDFPFDIRAMVGVPCLLTIVARKSKSGNEYSAIGGIGKPMKGVPVPEQETPSFIFDLDADDALEQVEKLPEWIQKTIKESPSYKSLVKDADEESDVPVINADDLLF